MSAGNNIDPAFYGKLAKLSVEEGDLAAAIAKLAQVAATASQTQFLVTSFRPGQKPQQEAMGVNSVIGADVIFTELLRAYLRSEKGGRQVGGGGAC